MTGPVGRAAAAAREIAERTAQALTDGASGISRSPHDLAAGSREAAGMLVHADHRGAIPVDTSGRALIRDDEVIGGRNEDVHTAWWQELRARGVDTDRTVSDLSTVWDYLRHDPKWAFDSERSYGGIIFFGSRDIGGSSVIANLVRDRGLGDVPVVFSGYRGEAAKFRLAAEKLNLNPNQIIEEPLAQNTGQNAVYSVRMLEQHGRDVSSVIGVCTPFHARRVWGTLMKQCPDVEHVAIPAADVSLENYMKYGNRPDATTAPHPKSIVAVTMGEIKRLDEYPDEGHIIREDIPDTVRDAYTRLSETFRPAERRF
ncbi:YdcF family protein [Nocardia otitidiscaviarum]|uniref:YdcF family protein n=1 Tax=Nocardia otitidiscaviarum TaxID=1823 RepID=UPI0009DFE9AB|nr:YdcF family protein [Nocardia otitidiscaviarum]MBF6488271.1 YdcF family protein [Nocardia otitidiscaviarum]